MKKIIKLSLVASMLFFAACGENKEQKKQEMPPSIVDVKKIGLEDASIYYEYAAKLEASKDVVVLPKVSGEIKEILFKDGDFVKKGTVLYKIDDEQYKANLDLALADISVARANYENASADFNRTKDLYNKKAVSKKEFDAKEAAYKSAKASLNKANASYKLAKLNYDYTSVKAPFDGYLQASLIDIGSYAVANNTKLVQIVDQDNLKATFFISDTNMEQIKRNNNDLKKAKASFILNGKTYEGEVEFVSNYNELASTKAYAVFKNLNQELSAGTFVSLKLSEITQANSLVISKENLLQDIDGYYVFIKDKNTAKQIHVKTIFDDEKIAVIDASNSSLKVDDELILNNYKKIYPGAKVATKAEFGAMMQKQASKEPTKE
ncbi:multidrug efflux system CmeABC, periplasmic fusion protein CmeA [Campylobacter sp. RM5004]|uniref:efflux RND transporter periplasmic adaptor subunit n=1 Tax=Campylobacter sp. RM5004 TaxID=1660078 RepID=UPI001EFB6B06|nr:efflux RND transporter periplasmic adaptor subunit [Campylobacter sp. RM5004]ULO01807.1 multidrug efflux system CmeABC, periplasmic fusion protein CmeA [Campylobacter sp. RM5004]